MKIKAVLLVIVLTAAVLTACSNDQIYENTIDNTYTVSHKDEKTRISLFAFDTYMTLDIYDNEGRCVSDSQAEELTALIRHLEKVFSTTDTESELYSLNNKSGNAAKLSPEMHSVIEKALNCSQIVEGAFDISVYPVVKAWGFTSDRQQIPSDEEIKTLLGQTGFEKIVLTDTGAVIPEGMQIDLGGIAKGYLSDSLKNTILEMGYDSALLSLGGNITAVGKKPDGSDFTIGISDPAEMSETAGIMGYLKVCDTNVITSGNYERYFIGSDGKKYGHIIDPDTGYPAENGTVSVTVIGADGAMCDAYSTALFVLGEDKASQLYCTEGNFEYIIVYSDGSYSASEGILESFTACAPFYPK